MKKFILSSVLMLGLTFAANANPVEMPAPAIRAEFFSYSDFCAWYVAALFDRYNLDTSTAFGFAMYQAAVADCINSQTNSNNYTNAGTRWLTE